MEPLVQLRAIACALSQINIDTDQVLPARFMKEARTPETGYAPYLFHDLRRTPDGSLRNDFPLNDPRNHGAKIIAARRNFGSGSSREAAVYALVDAGIRCVLAPSHGDIFAANAVNNGLLPARIAQADIEVVLDLLAPGGVEIHLDLEACKLTLEGRSFDFQVDPVSRIRLLNGWDEIDMTRRYTEDIAAWCRRDRELRPWVRLALEPSAA
ncbi:3-isopropylmalate dehydratase small subunit [Variovorax sp. RA8]|uniref:3-isopropylmalate dehydratase small subunit n=1 Tax=Variovorax sp. (strain JCM 16519 / RA8) TaxID=662548 RepID=UPI000B1B1FB3|nr:3-isopropylmalate dehydratase small subunit [Variovorax sp. RA8]VTU43095.1 3-isopropylmalate dehydratase small subunit [Variovorax sp. RA8]